MALKSRKRIEDKMKEREEGFDLKTIPFVKLPEYNALHDSNMRHYFENSNVQKLLYNTGQIDRYGRVIDLEKTKTKLHILEREFREAERIEELRQKEEMEMRHRVQRKRFLELERTRRLETLEQLRADQAITHEIIDTMKSPISMYNSKSSISAKSSKYGSLGNSGFLVTKNSGSP